MNKENIITNIIGVILSLIVLVLAIIGIFNDSEAFRCTWYDIMLVLMIAGQELKIRMLVKECRERKENE